MEKSFIGETWKQVVFDFEYANAYTLEVSNYGRLRAFNKINKGKLLRGSMINGYRIVRMKFFSKRDEKTDTILKAQAKELSALVKRHEKLKQIAFDKDLIKRETEALVERRKKLDKRQKKDLDGRTIHFHSLVHRLVATYFCPCPSAEHTVVAHLDFNKLNNAAGNLKWMTPKENKAHQQKSHLVIESHKARVGKVSPKVAKLTITKVMLLKKLLNEGKPMKQLIKQFKITDTQILRIKRGENWSSVAAAP